MMEPIRYREHSFRPDNDPVWRKRGLKTFLPRRLLGHFLLALKQTVLLTDRKRALHFGDENSLIDLGTYEDPPSTTNHVDK